MTVVASIEDVAITNFFVMFERFAVECAIDGISTFAFMAYSKCRFAGRRTAGSIELSVKAGAHDVIVANARIMRYGFAVERTVLHDGLCANVSVGAEFADFFSLRIGSAFTFFNGFDYAGIAIKDFASGAVIIASGLTVFQGFTVDTALRADLASGFIFVAFAICAYFALNPNFIFADIGDAVRAAFGAIETDGIDAL